MKTAYLFPGQGSQFQGMGKDLYEDSEEAREYFDMADGILGYKLSSIMFKGSKADLKQTKVTQPAVYLYTIVKYYLNNESDGDAVAGHSLGEITALVAAGVLTFEQGLKLVETRANAMQRACDKNPGSMAAILGMENKEIEKICAGISNGIVVPANYNCPGQLVISGETEAVKTAVTELEKAGARRALLLPVGGAFHSPLMKSAEDDLAEHIGELKFKRALFSVYQNYTGKKVTDARELKKNLIAQLSNPVLWTQSIEQMRADGFTHFTELGARVLSGFVRKIDRSANTESV